MKKLVGVIVLITGIILSIMAIGNINAGEETYNWFVLVGGVSCVFVGIGILKQ